MKPPRSIFNRDFKYVPASRTDISKTFARIRKQLKEEPAKVTPIKANTRAR